LVKRYDVGFREKVQSFSTRPWWTGTFLKKLGVSKNKHSLFDFRNHSLATCKTMMIQFKKFLKHEEPVFLLRSLLDFLMWTVRCIWHCSAIFLHYTISLKLWNKTDDILGNFCRGHKIDHRTFYAFLLPLPVRKINLCYRWTTTTTRALVFTRYGKVFFFIYPV